MIDIGTTDFYFAVPNLTKRQLERYSLHLFDRWEQSVEENLLVPDYSLALEVEEGSIKGKGRIAVALGALYFGIGNYGSFISGLQIVRDQVVTVSDVLAKTAEQQLGRDFEGSRIRKRSGTLGALQRLFVQVQRGEITPEQATNEAEALIGDDAKESPEFMTKLSQSLVEAPRFHEQVQLPLESTEEIPISGQPHRDRRTPRPSIPFWPVSSHLRVEVWRESKKDKKNFRTVSV
ncbi:hypothetical protein WKR98_18230 [Pigmentiphaga sp. YJ18]|uniref:hypothetical protein n=1 Tax=Pigmentiphaga sp. YJ18 TaxID=3134907 RepID=UPI0031143C35